MLRSAALLTTLCTASATLIARRESSAGSALSIESVNPAVIGAQYAVRGELVLRAAEMQKQLKQTIEMLETSKKEAEAMLEQSQTRHATGNADAK